MSAGAAVAIAPFLVEVGVYVASTAGVAVSVAKLTKAVASIYSESSPIIDDQICRKHKGELKTLVIDFREVEAEKKIFGRTLRNVASQGTLSSADWAELKGSSASVVAKLRQMQIEVRSQRTMFREQPAISSTYATLQDILDEKMGIVRKIELIDWNESGGDNRKAITPSLRQDIQQLSAKFDGALQSLDGAINDLAAEAGKPCPAVIPAQ
jgi:hypothetical protein